MDREAALARLAEAVAAQRRAEQAIDGAVHGVREAGGTWAEIGECLGMSRQAAHERWGHLPRSGCRRRGCDCPRHLPAQCPCGHGPGRGYRADAGAS